MMRAVRKFAVLLIGFVTTFAAACDLFPHLQLGLGNVPASVFVPDADAQVSFQLLANYVVVEVTLHGMGPYKFILDTGAGVTIVSPEVAALLPQNFVGTTDISSGLSPNSISAQLIRVDELGIGTMRFNTFQAAILPSLQLKQSGQTVLIDGVLGMPLFRNLALTLDYPNRFVRLREGILPTIDHCLTLPISRNSSQLPIIALDVDGRRIDAIVDTGYNDFLVVPSSFTNLSFIGPTMNSTATTVTGTFNITKGTLDGNVDAGCLSYQTPPVSVGGGIAALGAKAFFDFVLTIDQSSGSIRFQQ